MEEQYLREELNMRLSNLYAHSNSTVTFVITVWSAIIALVSVFHENFQNNLQILTFFIPIIFLITSFYIFFAAQKFNENLTQINKIATYYACFYNVPLSKVTDRIPINSWEYSTLELQANSILQKIKSQRVLTHMNGEYVFFSAISMIIVMVITGSGLYFWRTETNVVTWLWIYTIIIVGINLFLIYKIYVLTSLAHITEKRLSLMCEWIEYGKKKGIFTPNYIKERFGTILDAYQKLPSSTKRFAHRYKKKK